MDTSTPYKIFLTDNKILNNNLNKIESQLKKRLTYPYK